MSLASRAVVAGLCACAPAWVGAECNVSFWVRFKGTDVFRTPDAAAYFYRTRRVAIDADGAPNAYNPEDTGLDKLSNAGYPQSKWWPKVLVVDPANPQKPLVRRDGPYAGYYISKTSLSAPGLPEADPGKYVNAASIPYVVFPTQWYPVKGSGVIGDFAYAKSADGSHSSAAIVADAGGGDDAAFGEISVKLAESLGAGVASPRNGPSKDIGEIVYAVFPRSKANPAWPVAIDSIQQRADALLAKAGGWPDSACMKK